MPSASRRSVLMDIAFNAPFTCRVSISAVSEASLGQAAMVPICSPILRARVSGAQATSTPSRIFPCSLITHSAAFANDTSNPTNSFIPWSSIWFRYGKVDNLPLILQAVTGSARRRPRYSIS